MDSLYDTVRRPYFDHSTLTIRDGERVGLVGRNGAGKTTFLQIAAGILQPDAGEFVRRRIVETLSGGEQSNE